EFDPDAIKVATQVFVGALAIPGRNVGRVRIEFRQHVLECLLDKVMRIYLVYVRLLDLCKYLPEFPYLRVDVRVVSFSKCGANEYSCRQARKKDERKPDLTLRVRNLHTPIMPFCLIINEIVRKFILCSTHRAKNQK